MKYRRIRRISVSKTKKLLSEKKGEVVEEKVRFRGKCSCGAMFDRTKTYFEVLCPENTKYGKPKSEWLIRYDLKAKLDKWLKKPKQCVRCNAKEDKFKWK